MKKVSLKRDNKKWNTTPLTVKEAENWIKTLSQIDEVTNIRNMENCPHTRIVYWEL